MLDVSTTIFFFPPSHIFRPAIISAGSTQPWLLTVLRAAFALDIPKSAELPHSEECWHPISLNFSHFPLTERSFVCSCVSTRALWIQGFWSFQAEDQSYLSFFKQEWGSSDPLLGKPQQYLRVLHQWAGTSLLNTARSCCSVRMFGNDNKKKAVSTPKRHNLQHYTGPWLLLCNFRAKATHFLMEVIKTRCSDTVMLVICCRLYWANCTIQFLAEVAEKAGDASEMCPGMLGREFGWNI